MGTSSHRAASQNWVTPNTDSTVGGSNIFGQAINQQHMVKVRQNTMAKYWGQEYDNILCGQTWTNMDKPFLCFNQLSTTKNHVAGPEKNLSHPEPQADMNPLDTLSFAALSMFHEDLCCVTLVGV